MKKNITFIIVLCLFQASFAQKMLSFEYGHSTELLNKSDFSNPSKRFNIASNFEIPFRNKRFGLDIGFNILRTKEFIYNTYGCATGLYYSQKDESYVRYDNRYTIKSGVYYFLLNRPRFSWKISTAVNFFVENEAEQIFNAFCANILERSLVGINLENTFQYRIYKNIYAQCSQSINYNKNKYYTHYFYESSYLNLNAGLGYKF